LFDPDARDPYFLTGEGSLEWFYFSDKTTGFPVFNRFIKGIGTLLVHKFFQPGGIGYIGLNCYVIFFSVFRPNSICFTKQPPIQGKNLIADFPLQ
jgi:hypothetical protein